MAIAAIATLFIVLGAPMPTAAAWPYVIASGVIHIVYNCCLVWSYRIGDFSRANPIARGSSPLLVALGALLTVQEAIAPIRLAGVVLVSAGILLLALQRGKVSGNSVVAALVTGAVIALYTVVDGVGVRLSAGHSLAYTPWMFAFYWLMAPVFLALRGRGALRVLATAPWGLGLARLRRRAGLGTGIRHRHLGHAGRRDGRGVARCAKPVSSLPSSSGGSSWAKRVSRKTWLACFVVAGGAICLGL